MNLSIITQIWKENNIYIAYCPLVDISSCGESMEEAKKNLYEAIEAFMEEAKKMNTLDEILKESGFIKSNNDWESPSFISFENTKLKI